ECAPAQLDEQVHLVALLVSEIERLVLHASSDQLLLHFARDPRFEDGAAKRVREKLFGVANTEQKAKQPAVPEVQLRSLDEALAQVAIEGPQRIGDERGFEDREPAAGGRVSHA